MHILTATLNPALDVSCSVPSVAPERKLRCSEPIREPGGGGLNVARAITRLGGQAKAIWASGGPTGEMLAELLDGEQVEHEPVRISGLTRENLMVFEESTGQQYRFGMPGAPMTSEEIEAFCERVRTVDPPPEFLVLSGSLPPSAEPDVWAEMARNAPPECRVVLDTSGAALRSGIAAGVYMIKPNLRELGQLVGEELHQEARVEGACRRLIEEGKIEVVVVSIGSGGAMLVTSAEVERVRAPLVPIRSKVGAGDSMVAGIVLSLARGKSLSEAVRFGVAAGAAAVMTDGSELCRRDDAERLYREMTAAAGVA